MIPFAAEPRLRELFAGELPDAPEARFDFNSVQWASQFAFLTSETVSVAPDDLLKLNQFLLYEPQRQDVVPIKERSLEIFGDEKRLDALVSTSIFRAGRIDLVKDLKCEIVGEPIGWKRGPAAAHAHPHPRCAIGWEIAGSQCVDCSPPASALPRNTSAGIF